MQLRLALYAVLPLTFAFGFAFPTRTLYRDVIIVGGGASGAHAAVRLREDYGKSIVLIEKEPILGGHVDSYIDPKTGRPFNYGVYSFIDYANSTAFFAKLNVTTTPYAPTLSTNRYVDFTTGHELTTYIPPPGDALGAALQKYRELTEKYEDLLIPGYWKFPKPNAIPEDLLLPFGEFVTKHGIEALVPLIWPVTGLGTGNISKALTLYVMQLFGAPMARIFTGAGTLSLPASMRNQDLYDAIGKLLGKDVLYSSTVTSTVRNAFGVTVTVEGSRGERTVIHGKKLLLAIRPTLQNLQPFDLDSRESNIFRQWEYVREYAAIYTNPSLPKNFSFVNLPKAAEPHDYFAYPEVPFTGSIDYMGDPGDIFRSIVVGNNTEAIDSATAKRILQRDFRKLVNAGIIPPTNQGLNIVAFSEHGPMHLGVPKKALKSGFVQQLYDLQDRRSTWYTGGAFSVYFQTILWAYNDILLPQLVDSL